MSSLFCRSDFLLIRKLLKIRPKPQATSEIISAVRETLSKAVSQVAVIGAAISPRCLAIRVSRFSPGGCALSRTTRETIALNQPAEAITVAIREYQLGFLPR